jgi:two-component system, OmpR family, response regulator
MKQALLNLGELKLDPFNYRAFRCNRQIRLRPREFELLEFLARHKGRVINRLTLLEQVWRYEPFSRSNTLNVHMATLRRKIDGKNSKKLIQTVCGLGYRLCP